MEPPHHQRLTRPVACVHRPKAGTFPGVETGSAHVGADAGPRLGSLVSGRAPPRHTADQRGAGPGHRQHPARALRDRHRDATIGEGVVGGFSGLYAAFSSLEDVGTIRRGYFIEGLGGAQFAIPGAIERLRHSEAATDIVLATTDPANAYGASVPWPESSGRPERRAGASVALIGGTPAAWMDAAGRRIATFGRDPGTTVAGISLLADAHRRPSISTIDDGPAHEHPLATEMVDAGFTAGYKGFTPRRTTDRRMAR